MEMRIKRLLQQVEQANADEQKEWRLRDDAKKKILRIGGVLGAIMRGVFLFSLSLILLYPLIIMLSISFRDSLEIFDPTVVWIPKTFVIDNYVYVIKEVEDFFPVIGRTTLITLVSTLLQLISCSLAGYGFARFKFPFKSILFGALVFSIIVPSQLIMIPSYVDFMHFDLFGLGSIVGLFTGKALTVTLIDNYAAYFLPAALASGIRGSLYIFIFIQFFRGMPRELEDAAYIDGCNRFRTFASIMLPNSRSSIVTVTLFSIVWYWNDYYYNATYFSDLKVVSRALLDINTLLGVGIGTERPYEWIVQSMASAILFILPLLVLYIVFQRYFTESIERTGIVG